MGVRPALAPRPLPRGLLGEAGLRGAWRDPIDSFSTGLNTALKRSREHWDCKLGFLLSDAYAIASSHEEIRSRPMRANRCGCAPFGPVCARRSVSNRHL